VALRKIMSDLVHVVPNTVSFMGILFKYRKSHNEVYQSAKGLHKQITDEPKSSSINKKV